MKKITCTLSKSENHKTYTICIGSNLLDKIASLYDFRNYSKAFIIADKNTELLFVKQLVSKLPIEASFIVLPSGEKEKNIENIKKIWTAMYEFHCDRKSIVINLGGGVIGDIGGFGASTFMRGIDFINIPTTLLAQVDASAGGKTGIDFIGIKNLIGTFDQPKAVIIDVATLTPLPKREFLSGFAEIIKHGLIADNAYFRKVVSKKPLEFGKDELTDIIARSCEIKSEIVMHDETETGQRKLLNFGHTIGHAIEAISLESQKPLLHGEAVGIGMLIEVRISHLLGMISQDDLQTIQQALHGAGLPVAMQKISIAHILQKMKSDKKSENGQLNFTLLTAIGKAVINQQVQESIIKKALTI